MTHRIALRFLVAAGLVATGPLAHAALTVFDSQAAFLAAVQSPGTDAFDDLTVQGGSDSPRIGQAGAYGYTASTPGGVFFGVQGSSGPALSTLDSNAAIAFTGFGGNASAIGGSFFTTEDAGDLAPGSLQLVATDSSGATLTRSIDITTGPLFLGFTSTVPLTSLTVTTPTTGLFATVDNLTLAVSAVPEPASWLLLPAGLIGVAVARRRARLCHPRRSSTSPALHGIAPAALLRPHRRTRQHEPRRAGAGRGAVGAQPADQSARE